MDDCQVELKKRTYCANRGSVDFANENANANVEEVEDEEDCKSKNEEQSCEKVEQIG